MCFLIHWTKVTNPQDQRLRQRFVEDTVVSSICFFLLSSSNNFFFSLIERLRPDESRVWGYGSRTIVVW